MTREVWAIRHVMNEDLGNFAPVLAEAGFNIRYLESPSCDFGSLDPLAPDLLVVLGGPMGVYEADRHPFLAAEIGLLKKRLAADRPTLGICLGSQLMAAALGAKVYPGGRKEIGWMPISLTAAGRNSPLAGLDAAHGPVFHWHGDTFDLPEGAVHLAASALFPHQAFSRGRALALQFHPEVTAEGLESWMQGINGEIENVPGLTVASLRKENQEQEAQLLPRSREFLSAWLESLK